jgi:hypothetical protein
MSLESFFLELDGLLPSVVRDRMTQFRCVVSGSALRPHDDEGVTTENSLFVAGYPSWNLYDRALLVSLERSILSGAITDLIKVYVGPEFETLEDIQSVFPWVGESDCQGPWFELRSNGLVEHFDSGQSAVSFLVDRYGLRL